MSIYGTEEKQDFLLMTSPIQTIVSTLEINVDITDSPFNFACE